MIFFQKSESEIGKLRRKVLDFEIHKRILYKPDVVNLEIWQLEKLFGLKLPHFLYKNSFRPLGILAPSQHTCAVDNNSDLALARFYQNSPRLQDSGGANGQS